MTTIFILLIVILLLWKPTMNALKDLTNSKPEKTKKQTKSKHKKENKDDDWPTIEDMIFYDEILDDDDDF